jgi:DNA (cytosine-5)-methyltransferase 1
MFDILKRKVRRAMGDNPIVLDGVSYSYNQQVMILQNHLKLANVGFGVPHSTFDLGEKILDIWLQRLVDVNDEEVAPNVEEYRIRLNESFRLQDDEVNAFVEAHQANQSVLRVFEGFAGYGGASYGLSRVKEQNPLFNYYIVGYSEFDKYASALFDANHQHQDGTPIHNFGDITQVVPEDIPDFDIFTGGFPCQPFSSAGMQRGEDDLYGRGTLFYHIMRICKVKRPRYILMENVKGLTAKKFEPTFNRMKEMLTEMGYGENPLAYAVLNSKDYGIPQNRERLWMFARLGGLPEGFNIVPPRVENGLLMADFLDENPPQDLYLSQEQIAHLKEKHNIESFVVDTPLCFDVYNKKIKRDGYCITITQPEHNSLRVIEPPLADGLERVRKMSITEQFRLMGLRDGEMNFADQSYTQLSKRAGNGWDVNLVGILLSHIFNQLGEL